MNKGDYILIQAPMVTELKLSGNNLIIFALIHGFCRDGKHEFHGSIDYICKWTNLTRPTVISTLKALTESGLLTKSENVVNNVKMCSYSSNYDTFVCGSKEILPLVKKTSCGSKEILPNIYSNNDNDKSLSNNINYEEVKMKWEEVNKNLPSIRSFNEKRKKALCSLLKLNNATLDDLYKAFRIISVCSFCNGNNDRKWVATLDWLINDTKSCFNRLFEGSFAFTDVEKNEVKRIVNNLSIDSNDTSVEETRLNFNGQIYR